MKITVRLSRSGCQKQTAAMATIMTNDGDQIELVLRSTARLACIAAAEKLRKLAFKFYVLAHQEEPFKERTQNAVNAGRRK